MVPELGILMQTDTSYAEDLLGIKFKPARDSIKDAGNSVNSFVFISSGYADPKSSGDYLKFKGEFEEELKRLNFPKLGIMRPSFLLGDRKEKRIGEKIGIFVFKLLSPLFLGPLKKMKPIHSTTVAKAMIAITQNDSSQTIFESNEISEIIN